MPYATVTLTEFLEEARTSIVDAAAERLNDSHLERYELIGEHETRLRLSLLYTRLLAALRNRELKGMVEYASELGRARFACGYGLDAVQSAFNALEEATWLEIVTELPAGRHSHALSLVSTVFGAGKDALGRAYTAAAAARGRGPVDVEALFAGSETTFSLN